jgi:hypothetical protein
MALRQSMNITKDESVFCCFCGRKMGSFEGFWVMVPGWHRHAFTCGHETKYECPECAEKNNLNGPFAECSQCGCGEVYT